MLIQRVQSASVETEGRVVGAIHHGLLIFLAIHRNDHEDIVPWMVRKAIELRIFPNEQGKADLTVEDVQGSVLVVSQFTLYANCSSGRRPDFLEAAPPLIARTLYDIFVAECVHRLGWVETGLFGAPMLVSLINDGPYTIIIDSPPLEEGEISEEEKKNKKG